MGQIGNNFHQMVLVGQAVAPQSITSATVNGNAIVEPQKTHRQITWIVMGGAIATNGALTFTLEGRKRSDHSTFDILKDAAGSNVTLTGAAFADAGAIENGVVIATLRVDQYDTNAYEAVRLKVAEGGGGASLVSIAYVLSDPLEKPTAQADQFHARMVGL